MTDRQRLLELALKGLEAERAGLDDEIAQIKSRLNSRPAVAKGVATASPTIAPKRKTMSAAARRKISEGMKRRYAEINTAKKASEGSHAASKVNQAVAVGLRQSSGEKQIGGNRLTAAGRKKLSDLMKKRWAEKRKARTK
ncbi:MAG TPA: hypothetical protein VJK29_00800 [Terriglobales bacterium]|nr:hypothetical protein [Terriglobales bacterium]